MADIFLSYASSDRNAAEGIARALKGRGYDVWWDPDIPAGPSYTEVIEQALMSAKCVVVLWSAASVTSEWVQDEAREAQGRGVLVAARLASVKPPLGFRGHQLADLAGWQGDAHAREFQRLLRGIEAHVGPSAKPEPAAQLPLRSSEAFVSPDAGLPGSAMVPPEAGPPGEAAQPGTSVSKGPAGATSRSEAVIGGPPLRLKTPTGIFHGRSIRLMLVSALVAGSFGLSLLWWSNRPGGPDAVNPPSTPSTGPGEIEGNLHRPPVTGDSSKKNAVEKDGRKPAAEADTVAGQAPPVQRPSSKGGTTPIQPNGISRAGARRSSPATPPSTAPSATQRRFFDPTLPNGAGQVTPDPGRGTDSASGRPEDTARTSSGEKACSALLAEYERSVETRDFERLKRLIPDVPDTTRNTLRSLASLSMDPKNDCVSYVPRNVKGGADVVCTLRVRALGSNGGLSQSITTSLSLQWTATDCTIRGGGLDFPQ